MDLLTHNQTRHGYRNTSVYRLWAYMVTRCENEKSNCYKDYGGRSIKVCDEWRTSPKSFCDWAIQNGYEKSLEIDRIDVNGNYEPSNCQFITHKQNCAPNKRRIRVNSKTGERNIIKSKSGKYEAYAHVDGKQKYIGVYPTIEEAILSRDKAEVIGTIFDEGERE